MATEPLASRMRPTTIDEIIGQQHLLGKGKLLRRLIESEMLFSIILYGPPGTGKTTIANVIAHTTKSNFRSINATTSGKKDMQDVVFTYLPLRKNSLHCRQYKQDALVLVTDIKNEK